MSSEVSGDNTIKKFRLKHGSPGDRDRVGLYFPEELGLTSGDAIVSGVTESGTPCEHCNDDDMTAANYQVTEVADCGFEPMFTDGSDA